MSGLERLICFPLVTRHLAKHFWYPRQGSNLRPFAPEANALIH